MAAILLAPNAVLALPNGLSVKGGRLSVTQPDGSTLIINQGSDRAVGDWNSFDIGAEERVLIQQPDPSSLMLGRITSGSATEILGSLTANGGVVLINPNGMLVGADAPLKSEF